MTLKKKLCNVPARFGYLKIDDVRTAVEQFVDDQHLAVLPAQIRRPAVVVLLRGGVFVAQDVVRHHGELRHFV